ncbi:low molecular weight protein arginine phosphatase [Mammaliicoccus stepanovicii]|uniref:Low molecular weight protein-tyrosine-phosphatase PtpB n=1 Tax=Mammaliicoccus stepanovicii TaxID=643214 RepID=A0A239YPX5_9STAP|nr:low molecular weight protein arginine phosphatase [Mammaliicoccus stepanovicii]PNZ78916.1 low molecular weight phosphatase family protein [Mammaliicoccus stepanovicii]GGI41229.1 low molecular weight protein-tyrosine-phosphatase PtpB [Mammaliicoccus stepanovicii]SNV60298.1 phosphatase [Mammaliicoccus stepanovicii]
MKIIFVCTGNTCRSPLAEAIAKNLKPNFDIQSRGISAFEGANISQQSLEIILEHDLPVPGRAQNFSEQDLDADLILTMTESHKLMLQSEYQHENIDSIKHYLSGEQGDVCDPYGQSIEVYRNTFKELNELIEELLQSN